MNKLIIKQPTGSRETVSPAVITELYAIANATTDSNIELEGWLYTTATYKVYKEYLEHRFDKLTIDAGAFWVRFNDFLFESGIAKKINGSSHITENEADSLTSNWLLCTYINDKDIKELDFTPFKNLKIWRTFSTSNNDNINSIFYNIQDADVLNFGNVEQIVFNENQIYVSQFNILAGNNTFVNTVIAENVKYIATYAFRGLYFNEIYLPNIIAIGAVQGNTYADNSAGKRFERHFLFFGSKFQKFANMQSFFTENNHESHGGIIVIAAETPPKTYSFNANAPLEGEEIAFSANKYNAGAWDYYVPTSSLSAYKSSVVWQIMDDLGKLHPFSELPEEYKQKVSKWYTE